MNNGVIANKLTLNTSKFNVIILNAKKKKKGKSFKKSYNDALPEILIVKIAKCLCVTFDESSFACHIKNLTKRLLQSFEILAKVELFLNKKTLLNLYYSIFHSHLQ